jgi:succinoglycan biosynthesis transport protein ExoP
VDFPHQMKAPLEAPHKPARQIAQRVTSAATILDQEEGASIDIRSLLRSYLPLGLLLMAGGALLAMSLVVLETPLYRAELLLEVQPVGKSVTEQVMDPFSAVNEVEPINLQTQLLLLQRGPFTRRVSAEMRSLPVPPVPRTHTAFELLRRHLRPSADRQALLPEQSIGAAAGSFTASLVTDTRLVQLSCTSPNPIVASDFLNRLARDFINDSLRNRSETSEKTNVWLNSHIEETKRKLQSADARLRTFVLRSGNAFSAGDATVDDVKLRQFQGDLAAASSVRIAKQAEYENAVGGEIEAVPQVVQDPIAASLRTQLSDLERQRAVLLTALTPLNPKVKAIDDQREELQGALKREAGKVVARLKSEYESAVQHERLLLDAYGQESGQVSSLASRAAEYAALRREVDSLQKTYDSLLQEMNRTEVAESAPITPIRLVEESAPPQVPYTPKPASEIMLGLIGGLAITVGIGFFREKMDRRLRSPEALQSMVRVPQLGVIPAAERIGIARTERGVRSLSDSLQPAALLSAGGLSSEEERGLVAHTVWGDGTSPLADSFRATLASINRLLSNTQDAKVLMVTSSIPGEGKTTVVSNLGIALAEAGRRVVLVDADFRRPALSKVFRIDAGVSLPEILTEELPIAEYPPEALTVTTDLAGLHLLPSKAGHGHVPNLVYSERLARIVERFRHEFDLVLLDVPPILFPADARIIGHLADGVVLVVRADHSDRESIRAAVNCLHQDGTPILGTVLNNWDPSGSRSGMRYYNYYDGRAAEYRG